MSKKTGMLQEVAREYVRLDLLDQLVEIALRTKEYLGTSNLLTQKLWRAARMDDDGNTVGVAELREALHTFAALPASKRLAIFNGWDVPIEPRPREELQSQLIGEYVTIVRGLNLTLAHDGSPEASFEYRFQQAAYQDVSLFIREGTPLKTVLKNLLILDNKIRHDWAQLIVDPERKAVTP